jgi:hypothetical protein
MPRSGSSRNAKRMRISQKLEDRCASRQRHRRDAEKSGVTQGQETSITPRLTDEESPADSESTQIHPLVQPRRPLPNLLERLGIPLAQTGRDGSLLSSASFLCFPSQIHIPSSVCSITTHAREQARSTCLAQTRQTGINSPRPCVFCRSHRQSPRTVDPWVGTVRYGSRTRPDWSVL